MLYLHPKTSIADAAIHAFENGAHLETKAGRVAVVEGRNYVQAHKARRIKALERFAKELRGEHNN